MNQKEIRKEIYSLIEKESSLEVVRKLHIPLRELLKKYVDVRNKDLINANKEYQIALEGKKTPNLPKKENKPKEPKEPKVTVWHNF